MANSRSIRVKVEGICKISNCTRDIKHPTMGLCGPCYASMRLFGKKTPGQALKRITTLSIFAERCMIMSGNVTKLKTGPVANLSVLPGNAKKFKLKSKHKRLKIA